MRKSDELHIAARELVLERRQRQFATLVDLQVAQLGAPLAAQDLPGDEVPVMLHLRDQHRVAGSHVVTAPGIGDEVDRLGDVLREDRGPWLAPYKRCDPLAGALIGRVRLLRERVHAAVHVRVVRTQVARQRVYHRSRLLGGRRRVEV